MEQFRTKIKHILPFLLALVVLISCIPPIQASAVDSLVLTGHWKITSGWETDVAHGDIQGFSVPVNACVMLNGSLVGITDIFLDPEEPGVIGATLSYGGGQDRLWFSNGDHSVDDGIIRFYSDSPTTITDSHAIAFLSAYAEPVGSCLYINGTSVHNHPASWFSQSIVDENGTTFTCSVCDWELPWSPSDSGTFSGFRDQDGNVYFGQCAFNVDGDLHLVPVYTEPDPDPEPVTYTTYSKVTQNLADWTGTYIIVYEASSTQGYVFTGVDAKLNSVLLPVDSGKIVVSSDQAVCPVRIEPYGTGYSIKLLSGAYAQKYIYAGSGTSNKISFAAAPKQLTVSQVGTISYILDGEIPFQFNKTSSYLWFRFFGSKPGGQSEIALYKLDDGSGGGSSPDPSYKLIIDDHEEHSHTYAWGCQTEVEPTGTVFDCPCGWNLIWYATGNGTFSGFKDQDGNTYFGQCQFDVNGELRLTSIYDQSTPDPGTTYTSTITIDGVPYQFTSTKEKPAVTLQVISDGVILTYGDQSRYSFSVGSKTFLGLGYISGGAASLIPGETYKLAAGDHTLYMIYSDAGTKYMLQAGQWQARFNSSTSTYYNLSSWPDGLASVPVSFVSAGFAFNEISYLPDGTEPGFLFYGSTPAYSYALSEWYGAHALVYFAVDQEVPEAFYKWFTANFTRTGDSMVSPVYSATINIYDNTGATLLQSFTFTDVSALDVSLDMTGQTCVFRGNSLSSTWSPNSSMFSGFALSPGAAYPVFSPGFNYELPVDPFAGVPVTLNLYVTSGSTGSEDASDDIQAILSGFIATFVAPVMFFFSVQFIPGFSIGKLCLFAFCFGLLFWFLKVVR